MPGIKRNIYFVCPYCWSIRVKNRVMREPRYRCEVCKQEFSIKKRISYIQRQEFNNILRYLNQSYSDTPSLRQHIVKDWKEVIYNG